MALAGLAACGGGRKRPPPPEPSVVIWTPGFVRWDGRGDRAVRFVLENGTSRTVTLAAPDPRRARVTVYGEEDRPVCATEPSEPPGGDTVSLAPGDELPVRVDLSDACRSLPPGEYRLEIGYQPPKGGPGEALAPHPRSGVLVVSATGR